MDGSDYNFAAPFPFATPHYNSSAPNTLPPRPPVDNFSSSDTVSNREEVEHPSEDENPLTRRTHSATWAGRNASRPIIKPRAVSSRPLTEAVKKARKITREQNQEANERLRNAVTMFVVDQNAKISEIAKAHNIKEKRVQSLVVNQTQYRSTRKTQLYNALISAKAREVNAGKCSLFTQYFLLTLFIGLPSGERHSLAEVQKLVAEDPETQNLTEEKKQAYLAELSNSRYAQKHGVRANNAAAARDVFKTVEKIENEVGVFLFVHLLIVC